VSRIFCNIHPTMAAYVVVVDSTFFAVTDARGAFRVPALGRGTRTYHLWRAGDDTATGAVLVDPAQPLLIDWP
jgi:hypothetical protein